MERGQTPKVTYMSLARPCAAICEYRGVESIEEVLDRR